MTETTSITRVLMALDSGHPSAGGLRAVARLLGRQDLDLMGLYVEDEDLLKAASLPGLREVTLSGRQSPLNAARLARDMAGEADSARRSIQAVAETLMHEHVHLRHRFTVARGRIAEEAARAAAESDFVLVIRTLRASGIRPRRGRDFAELVRGPRHVLFVNEPWASGSSVVVLHGSEPALARAASLADAEGLRLVLVAGAAAPEPAALPAGAVVRRLASLDEEAIADVCLAEDARLLVLPESRELNWAELLVSLMDKLPCSLLKLAAEPAPPAGRPPTP